MWKKEQVEAPELQHRRAFSREGGVLMEHYISLFVKAVLR